jgi:hypothetical protein
MSNRKGNVWDCLVRLDLLSILLYHSAIVTFLHLVLIHQGKCRGQEVAIKKLNVDRFDDGTVVEITKEVKVMTYVYSSWTYLNYH